MVRRSPSILGWLFKHVPSCVLFNGLCVSSSGPHACKTGTLLTKPTQPQSLVLLIEKVA